MADFIQQTVTKTAVRTLAAPIADVAVVAFFDPADETVSTAPASIPGRSYKMGTATKRWLTFDHSPEERESLLRQVAEAESERKAAYTITVPSAWYEIEYGLVKASGKTEA